MGGKGEEEMNELKLSCLREFIEKRSPTNHSRKKKGKIKRKRDKDIGLRSPFSLSSLLPHREISGKG